jgi:hypothetical protein
MDWYRDIPPWSDAALIMIPGTALTVLAMLVLR